MIIARSCFCLSCFLIFEIEHIFKGNVLCFSQPGIQLDFNFACASVFLNNKVNVILVIILFFAHILYRIAPTYQIVLYNLKKS